MIIYSDTSWPLWARIAIAVFSVGLLGVLIWGTTSISGGAEAGVGPRR